MNAYYSRLAADLASPAAVEVSMNRIALRGVEARMAALSPVDRLDGVAREVVSDWCDRCLSVLAGLPEDDFSTMQVAALMDRETDAMWDAAEGLSRLVMRDARAMARRIAAQPVWTPSRAVDWAVAVA